MVNYPNRENYPKFLEDGWDKTDDTMQSLPIVWELEKIGTNDVGLWDALKYEDVDGNSEVIQNTDEGIELVSNTIPNIMNIDELTIGGKRVKICDVYDYEKLRTHSGYEDSVRFSSGMKNIYKYSNNFQKIFEYEYNNVSEYECYPLKIKDKITEDELRNLMPDTSIFEMADMANAVMQESGISGNYIVNLNWSRFQINSLDRFSFIDTIMSPYRGIVGYLYPAPTKKYNIIIKAPSQYSSISEAGNTYFNDIYTSFNWNYRYAIDFEKSAENSETQFFVPDLLNMGYDRFDIIGGKSYQFDRTIGTIKIDLQKYDEIISADLRRIGRLTLNVYGKISNGIFVMPKKEGQMKPYLIDFNFFGINYNELSNEDKEDIEYLKTYCDCTFTFLPQPLKENTKDYEKIENIGIIGNIRNSNVSGKYDISLNRYQIVSGRLVFMPRNPNVFGEVVFKNEYMMNDTEKLDGKNMVLENNGYAICSTNAEKVIVEDGIYMIGNNATFNGLSKLRVIKSSAAQCESTYFNTDESEFKFNGTFRQTPKLKKMNGMNAIESNIFTGAFVNSYININKITIIDENNGYTPSEDFNGAQGIQNIVINSTGRTNPLNFTRLFINTPKLLNVELNGYSDDVIKNSTYTNFVSSNCKMKFTVDTLVQKAFLETKIMEVLGISSMSDTQITVESREVEKNKWDISANQDGTLIAKYDEDTQMLNITGSGQAKAYYSASFNDETGEATVDVIEEPPFIEFADQITGIDVNVDGAIGISTGLFSDLISLQSFSANRITNINDCAFYGCSSLYDVNLPAMDINFGRAVFNGCEFVAYFRYQGKNPVFVQGNFGTFNQLGTAATDKHTNVVNEPLINELAANGWQIEWDISANQDGTLMAKWEGANNPEGIARQLTISGSGQMKFYLRQDRPWNNLSEFNLSINTDAAINIPNEAFMSTNILSIGLIGNGDISNIGSRAFNGTRIQELNLEFSNSLQSIQNEAFSNCGSLYRVVLPTTIKAISDRAFYNCVSVSDFTCNAQNIPGFQQSALDGMGTTASMKNANAVYSPLVSKLQSLGYNVMSTASVSELSAQSLDTDNGIQTLSDDVETVEVQETVKKKRGRPKKTETTTEDEI